MLASYAFKFTHICLVGANGFLIDQFTQDVCNQRLDRWGGSIENRSRFALEVAKAVTKAIGPDRTGIKFSPWNTFRGMCMQDPTPQFTYLLEQLKPLDLAYLHLVHPPLTEDPDTSTERDPNQPFIKLWQGSKTPIILAGGYTAVRAKKSVDLLYPGQDIAIAMGRWFIANPDLVFRMQKGIMLNPYRRQFFYGPASREGYLDYTFSEEWKKQHISTLKKPEETKGGSVVG